MTVIGSPHTFLENEDFEPNSRHCNMAAALSETKSIIGFVHDNNDIMIYVAETDHVAQEITSSSHEYTISDRQSFQLTSGDTHSVQFVAVTEDMFLVHYSRTGSAGHYALLFSVSGTTVTLEDEIQTFTTVQGQSVGRLLDTNKILIGKADVNGSSEVGYVIVTVTGTTLYIGSLNVISGTQDCGVPSTALFSTTSGAMVVRDPIANELLLTKLTISGTTVYHAAVVTITQATPWALNTGYAITETHDTDHILLMYKSGNMEMTLYAMEVLSGSYVIGSPYVHTTSEAFEGGYSSGLSYLLLVGTAESENSIACVREVNTYQSTVETFNIRVYEVATDGTTVTSLSTEYPLYTDALIPPSTVISFFNQNGLAYVTGCGYIIAYTQTKGALTGISKAHGNLINSSTCLTGDGEYIIGMSVPRGSTFFYTTVWINGYIILQRWTVSPLEVVAESVLGEATLQQVLDREEYAVPFARYSTDLFIFGRLSNPGSLGLSHILYSDDFGDTVSKVEGGWGSAHCSALIADTSNNVYAMRSDGKFFKGNESSVLQAGQVPFSGAVRPHSLKFGESEEIIVATGGAGDSTVVMYSLPPYTKFNDITYDHPQTAVNAVVAV